MTRLYELEETYIQVLPADVRCPICSAAYRLDIRDHRLLLELPPDGTCEHFAFLMSHEVETGSGKMVFYEICWILNPEVQEWIEKMYIKLVTERPSSSKR